MTVAVSCNLSDGVVLAVDSAVTVHDTNGGVAKVYENADKLFQLGERPIGVAVFGLGTLGTRTIGSYVREFATTSGRDVVEAANALGDVVEGLRAFFVDSYREHVAPVLEQVHGAPFDELPPEALPVLGLIVGGFSAGEFLSEVWEIAVPAHRERGSAVRRREPGSFGTDWFAMYEPILRYLKGFDPRLIDGLVGYFKHGGELTPDETTALQEIVAGLEYQIPYAAMPMEEGIPTHAIPG